MSTADAATPAKAGAGAFAVLLRDHRLAAGLTQEELAERTGLSRRGISDLERGARRTPYGNTIRKLVDALDLDDAATKQLYAAARKPAGVTSRASTADTVPLARVPRLPIPVTSFIGREREVQSVVRLLSTTRLLTLVGTGGVGKTRLALEVARELEADFPDEVFVVELSALADPALVAQAVASAIEVREQSDRPLVDSLVRALQHRRVLVVLDNCEHLLHACAELVHTLLRTCSGLRILATSREPLRLAGEWRWRVPSLTLPCGDTRAHLEASEAVRLFVARGRAVLAEFGDTEHDLQVIGDVCRQLDGIPLAIELAAPLVSGLSIDNIAEHLVDRFALLTTGSRDALPRHQTLHAMVDWSYDLLDHRERGLLRHLSTFAGGWTLQAAQRVCVSTDLNEADVPSLLVRLVDQSLVNVDLTPGDWARYRLLETIRQYARNLLLADRQAATRIQHEHATYYTELANKGDAYLRGPAQKPWHARLEADLDNIRAALNWWLTCGDAESGVRLAGGMGWFWYQHSFLAEGRDWCERVLAMPPPQPTPRTYSLARVRALFAAGVLALQQGDFGRARTWHGEGLRLATAIDDPWGIAWSIQGLGHTFARTAQTDAARQYLHDSLTRWRVLGYRWGEAFALNWLGNAAYEDGDLDAADDLYHQALAIRRFVGDAFSSANTLEYLARIRRARGQIAAARELLEEALVVHQGIGDRRGGQGVAKAYLGLGRLACIDGDEAQACIRLSEALRLFHRVSDRPGLIDAIEAVGVFGQMRGRVEQAARLFAAASRLRSEVDQPLGRAERRELEAAISALRSRMGDDAFREAWESGWALSIEGAAESAQAVLR